PRWLQAGRSRRGRPAPAAGGPRGGGGESPGPGRARRVGVPAPPPRGGGPPGGGGGARPWAAGGGGGKGTPTRPRGRAPPGAPGAFGLGTSAPVVTSDGTNAGSALVWLLWSADNTGTGAELRAYDAVPLPGSPLGTLPLRYRASIGQAARYTPPGVGDGRI